MCNKKCIIDSKHDFYNCFVYYFIFIFYFLFFIFYFLFFIFYFLFFIFYFFSNIYLKKMIYYFLDKTFKNILLQNFNMAFIDELKKLANELNDLFKDADSNIKKMLLKKKLKPDTKKLLLLMLYVIFLIIHLFILVKQTVVSEYNYDNNLEVDRTSYYKKELKITS